jgi:hypothetical protein
MLTLLWSSRAWKHLYVCAIHVSVDFIIGRIALDDPNKVVKVVASDGKTGDTRELQYANCKVIGNGSFGVVFQARLLAVPKDQEDIAIKKVLQDKRFKVRPSTIALYYRLLNGLRIEQRASNHARRQTSERRRFESLLLLQRRQGGFKPGSAQLGT